MKDNYKVVLVSAVHQNGSAAGTHILSLPPTSRPSPPSGSSQSPSLSSPGTRAVPCVNRCFVSLSLLFLLLIPSLVLLLSEVFDSGVSPVGSYRPLETYNLIFS